MRYLLILLLFCQSAQAWELPFNPKAQKKTVAIEKEKINWAELEEQNRAIKERLEAKFANERDPYKDMWDPNWINKK